MTARLSTNRIWQLSHGLTPRDLAVVDMLARLRVASVRQLERVHFPGQTRTARRVLAELSERRILARLARTVGGVRAGSAGYIYALDVVGQYLGEQGGPAHGERLRRPWTPGSRFLDHALAVSELYVQLVEQSRAGRFELVAFEAEPDSWRVFPHLGVATTLKPDGFVRVGLDDEEAWFFVEVDRGSESVRTVESKAKVYRSYWESGDEQDKHGVFPLVLWLVPSTKRRTEVRQAVQRAGSQVLSRVATQDELSASTWTQAASETGASDE